MINQSSGLKSSDLNIDSNKNIGTYIYDPQTVKNAQISPMGEFVTASTIRLAGTVITGTTLDTNFWASTLANGGTISVDGQATLNVVNNQSNSSSILQSARTARYMASNANKFRGQIRIPDAGVTDNVRRWGAFSSTDGAFFELNGTTLKLVTRNNSNDTPVSNGSFNGKYGTSITVGTNVRVWEIYYNNGKVRFYVDDVLLHTVSASTTPWTQNIHLPVRIENTNTGNPATNNIKIEVRVASIVRIGEALSRPFYKNLSTNNTFLLKNAPGTLHRIVFNTKGAANNTLTMYDNLSAVAGTSIGFINTVNVASDSLEYDVDFYIGLTAVMATGTPANVTVVYE